MNYDEYQLWYHSYNNAITALTNKVYIEDIITEAAKIADFSVAKYAEVKQKPPSAQASLQSIFGNISKIIDE